MNEKIIAVDVDDVCADLVTEWLRLYNLDFKDNLKREDITNWHIHEFVKPECGEKIYEYVETKSIYDNVAQIKDSLKGVTILKTIGRVIFVTASTNGASGRKYLWLKDNGYIDSPKDYIECLDKSLIKYDILIDDKYDNIKNSSNNILFDAPWNREHYYHNRILSWGYYIEPWRRLGKSYNNIWQG